MICICMNLWGVGVLELDCHPDHNTRDQTTHLALVHRPIPDITTKISSEALWKTNRKFNRIQKKSLVDKRTKWVTEQIFNNHEKQKQNLIYINILYIHLWFLLITERQTYNIFIEKMLIDDKNLQTNKKYRV